MEKQPPDSPRRSVEAYLGGLGLDSEMVRAWMVSRSAHLDGEIPERLLEEGSMDQVMGAARAFADAVPPREYIESTRPTPQQPDNGYTNNVIMFPKRSID